MSADSEAPHSAPSAKEGEGTDAGLTTRRRLAGSSLWRSPQNVRIYSHVQKLFVLLLLLVLLLSFYGYRVYQKEIKPALARIKVQEAPEARAAPETETASPVPVARAIEIQLPADARRQLDEAAAQVAAIQKRLDEALEKMAAQQSLLDRAENARKAQEEQMQKWSAQIAALPAAGSARPAEGTSKAVSMADAAGVATDEPGTSPFDEPSSAGQAELRLMKERNRLSAYADEAISTGARRPLALIIETMKDPERAGLYHAAHAEYYRIMGHYQFINRIDPAYKLPLDKLFPGKKIGDEADLSTEQIIGLVQNKDIDWQSRLRAAFLLGGRRAPEVAEALLRVLKEDPNLDVAKEAQLSFEQNVGRHFLLFDIAGIDAWWRSQTAGEQEDNAKEKKEH